MKTNKKSYTSLSIYNNKYIADYTSSAEKLTQLTPGVYTLHYDGNTGTFWFQDFNAVADTILELDSPEYKQITTEMAYFLKPEVKKQFNDMGYIYKRSALLHGEPGTGKTCIVNRISKDVVKQGGVVLYVNNVQLLKIAFEVLSDLQPETLTLAVFEEFDDLARSNESNLLTLLDGEVQKENVMYLATTNYLERVPKRLYRPGRFSSVIKVNFPNAIARQQYLTYKLGDNFEHMKTFVGKTNGCSIDELKEVVQSVIILGNDLDDTLARLKATREFVPQETKDNDMFQVMKNAMLFGTGAMKVAPIAYSSINDPYEATMDVNPDSDDGYDGN